MMIILFDDFIAEGAIVYPAVVSAEGREFPAGHQVPFNILHEVMHGSVTKCRLFVACETAAIPAQSYVGPLCLPKHEAGCFSIHFTAFEKTIKGPC